MGVKRGRGVREIWMRMMERDYLFMFCVGKKKWKKSTRNNKE
jgi:hypothetical protein